MLVCGLAGFGAPQVRRGIAMAAGMGMGGAPMPPPMGDPLMAPPVDPMMDPGMDPMAMGMAPPPSLVDQARDPQGIVKFIQQLFEQAHQSLDDEMHAAVSDPMVQALLGGAPMGGMGMDSGMGMAPPPDPMGGYGEGAMPPADPMMGY